MELSLVNILSVKTLLSPPSLACGYKQTGDSWRTSAISKTRVCLVVGFVLIANFVPPDPEKRISRKGVCTSISKPLPIPRPHNPSPVPSNCARAHTFRLLAIEGTVRRRVIVCEIFPDIRARRCTVLLTLSETRGNDTLD